MVFGEAEWLSLQRIYTRIYIETSRGENLEMNLSDVVSTIEELNKIIEDEKSRGINPTRLEELKNDFYFLKLGILEST